MGLYYADGTSIEALRRMEEIKNPSREIASGKKLPEDLVIDDLLFDNLYDLWISICVKYVLRESDENIRFLFQPESEDAECREFMERYCKVMTIPGKPICPIVICNKIREAIERDMKDVSEYMKLRVLTVSVLLNHVPENIFKNGKSWGQVIRSNVNKDKYEADALDIETGMKFNLNLQGTGKLIPRTLRNKSEEMCEFNVNLENKTYKIQMPPYGTLRAVFADDDCKTLVSIKGNITFDDVKSAVIQQGEKDNCTRIKRHYLQEGTIEIPNKGFLLDVSTNGRGGIIFLNAQEMFSTMRMRTPKKLPIRCYGSGEVWAWLYADGKLESNLEGAGMLENVTAVAEDGDSGLLVCCKGECWDFRKLPKVKISESEMAQVMLKRFGSRADEGYCESVSTRYLQLSITQSGKMEEKKF